VRACEIKNPPPFSGRHHTSVLTTGRLIHGLRSKGPTTLRPAAEQAVDTVASFPFMRMEPQATSDCGKVGSRASKRPDPQRRMAPMAISAVPD
jgi:hypothetical protein